MENAQSIILIVKIFFGVVSHMFMAGGLYMLGLTHTAEVIVGFSQRLDDIFQLANGQRYPTM